MKCARCRRNVAVPVIVEGKGYGATCAAKVGDLLTQPQRRAVGRRRRAARADERQGGLFA